MWHLMHLILNTIGLFHLLPLKMTKLAPSNMNLVPSNMMIKIQAKSCMRLMSMRINILGKELILRKDGITKVIQASLKNSTMINYVTRGLLFQVHH